MKSCDHNVRKYILKKLLETVKIKNSIADNVSNYLGMW